MYQPEIGDWVIITQPPHPLCVVGRITGPSRAYTPGVTVDNVVVHYDPRNFDQANPNQWPCSGYNGILVEPVGEVRDGPTT